ncbi:MAG: tRNA (N6-isopentenyl adenosine(37)-C2)-methylthiotransferase MiaB [Mycoplasmoidaceae bacterium]
MKEIVQLANLYPSLAKAKLRSSNEIKYFDNLFKLTNSQKKLGKKKTFFVRTYGCQANERDSEIIKGILIAMGFVQSKDWKNANLVILNSCAIRQNAEDKVFGMLGALKALKKKRKDLVFGLCGCMPQQEKTIPEIKHFFKEINFIFGTHNIYELPAILENIYVYKRPLVRVHSHEGNIIENLPDYHEHKHKALVNIMYGCDHFCSYCIVPYTRGKIRSRDKNDILNEVLLLKKQGYKDITLLGQNVNSYGIDLKSNYRFVNLLEDVANTGIKRIRFATSNPWNFDKKIIDVIAKHPNLMAYIHLPIQSGSEKILKEMKRGMKISKYLEIIKTIRKKIPNCTISTDIIVGFPNETDKDFKQTIKLYKKVKFDNAYTFIYSPRIGTPAATIKDKIDMKTKQKRLTKLNELVRKYSKWNNNQYIGKTLEVLVDGASKNDQNTLTGYSHNWKVVNFKGKAKQGEFVKVKITSSSLFSLNGEMKK